MANSERDGYGRFAKSTEMIGQVDDHSEQMANDRGFSLAGGHIAVAHKHVVLTGLRGKYPGCDRRGNAMRSHVVWWLNTGEAPIGWNYKWVIHHRNDDKTNDCFENIEKLTHGYHSLLHHPIGRADVKCICRQCGDAFTIKKGRLTDKSRGRFCSQACYHAHPRSDETKRRQAEGLRRAYAEGRRA